MSGSTHFWTKSVRRNGRMDVAPSPSRPPIETDVRQRIVLGTTVGRSANVLLRGQASSLKSAGFDVTIVSAPGEELRLAGTREGVNVVAVPMQRGFSIVPDVVALFRLTQVIRRLRPDISNVGTPKAGLLIGIASFLCRVPVRIYTLRGLRLETVGGIRRLMLWITEWIACRSAHVVIAISPSLRRQAIDLHLVREDKVRVLGLGSSNGVDVGRFAPNEAREAEAHRFRSSLGIPEEARVIGYLGRFSVDKGVADLVSAFEVVKKNLPDVYLLLAGEMDLGNPLDADTVARIANSDRIVEVAWMDDPAMAYLSSTVVVLPTHREGFGNVLIEAAAASRPVVTTRATGSQDALLPGVTGLMVDIGDIGGLAKALTDVLSLEDRGVAMGREGQAWVSKEFEPHRIWDGLEELYREML